MLEINGNVVKCDGAIFIIPNASGKIASFLDYAKSRMEKLANKLCDANSTKFDPDDDRLVEFWWSSVEDLGCENLSDHIFSIVDLDGRKWYGQLDSRYAPAKLFEGHKEGEFVTINYPVSMKSDGRCRAEVGENDTHETWDITLQIRLELAQTKYRYSHRGNFEDALATV